MTQYRSSRGHSGLPLDFQECASGSWRLSATAAAMGLSIGFPVDYRYGWDLKTPKHQKLLDSCLQRLQVQVHFWPPPKNVHPGQCKRTDQRQRRRNEQ
eukprot:9483442-Pyramimonas_sp.AAC.1